MNNFYVAVRAVFPFLFYLVFGYGVKAAGMVDEAFLRKLNAMIFKAFFPIMMFCNLFERRDQITFNGRMMLIGALSVLVLFFALWLVVPRFVKEDSRRGVVIQAIYRSNFVLYAIPLTESVFGDAGAALASTMVIAIVPLYNMLAVIILEYYRGQRTKPLALIWKIVTNPLILGALVAVIFMALKLEIPALIEKPLYEFSDMTTPLAMFVLGGTLKFASMKKNRYYLTTILVIKMVLLPAVVIGVSLVLGMNGMERFVYLMAFATPVATASFTMAQNMGGDGDLAGELVVISTVVSIGTIFVWIYVLRSAGLI